MPEFTAHNIRLDDGTMTKPEEGRGMEHHHLFLSARRVLNTVFPGDKSRCRLADLGCLEGGYSVEFARMGFNVLGLDVREENLAACRYVKKRVNLPNLEFVKDDAWNISKYGRFDAIFCCGLFYHLDEPRKFLDLLSSVTSRVLLLYTHFAVDEWAPSVYLPRGLRLALGRFMQTATGRYALSRSTVHERLRGRWFIEFETERAHQEKRETARWASWSNRRSFWIQREHLLQAIRDAGFDLVLEQYDSLGVNIADAMHRGDYRRNGRGEFVGIKAG